MIVWLDILINVSKHQLKDHVAVILVENLLGFTFN